MLEAAMNAFWRKGYENTSISDLEVSTNLARGSIYKAFTDKRTLFLKSLERYLASTKKQYRDTLTNDNITTNTALTDVFQQAFTENKSQSTCGCFAMNCGVEFGPEDLEVNKHLHAQQGYLLRLLAKRIRVGQEDGEIVTSIEPQKMAQLLLIFHLGLSASARQVPEIRC